MAGAGGITFAWTSRMRRFEGVTVIYVNLHIFLHACIFVGMNSLKSISIQRCQLEHSKIQSASTSVAGVLLWSELPALQIPAGKLSRYEVASSRLHIRGQSTSKNRLPYSSVPRRLRVLLEQLIPAQLPILIRNRIMQCMHPNISPEPVKPNLGRRRL